MSEFIFNTSFYLGEQQLEDWNNWIQNTLLPEIENLLPGLKMEVFEVVSARPDENRIYSVQWRCNNIIEIEKLDDCVGKNLNGFASRFGENAAHFSSVMKKL
jgi:hypothetical protein